MKESQINRQITFSLMNLANPWEIHLYIKKKKKKKDKKNRNEKNNEIAKRKFKTQMYNDEFEKEKPELQWKTWNFFFTFVDI